MFQTPKKFSGKPVINAEDLMDQVLENTKPVPKEPAAALDAALAATEAVKKEPAKITVTPADAPAAVYRLMTFGRYQGRRLDTLPQSYLYWLLTIKLNDDLREAVLEVIKYTAAKVPAAPVVEAPLAPVERPVPKGWKRLPAGVKRFIRVNKEWIANGEGRHYIVVEGREESYYDEVEIEGVVKMACGSKEEGYGCGSRTKRFAHIETTSSLLVK
jgi:hypothetical protein